MRTFTLLFLAIFLAFTISLQAQTPPTPAPAAPKNLIFNPSFEMGFPRPNLWNGVDGSGYLTGERDSLPVLTTSGTIAATSMPLSVSVADLNGDGLLDIAAMDVVGYLRIYFNSGTKDAPKFTIGELSTIFLSRINAADLSLQGVHSPHARQGQRIYLTDIKRSGKKDLILGDYLGEIMLIPNEGSASRPEFRQPAKMEQVLIPTMKDPAKKWGNVFAPVTWDWNHDGKDDLLVGEGSYSANSVHLLINQGSAGKPTFDENNRSVLASGMGLEQLTPCIVDYNGDGHMDLLVTERTGKIAVYLNSGKPWKTGETLAFDSFIPIGGTKPPAPGTTPAKDPMTAATAPGLLALGGIATIAAGDINGDGLFDLIFGKSNGHIAISLNTGTATEPKFGAPADIKTDGGAPVLLSPPSGWECDYGLTRGNLYGFFSIVKDTEDPQALPADGKAVLKASYSPSPNKIMPAPNQYTPAFENFKPGEIARFDTSACPSNTFIFSQKGRTPLKTGKTYMFSVKIKGNHVSDGAIRISYNAIKKLSDAKIERGDRGSAKVNANEAHEEKTDIFKFSPGTQWSEVKKEFTVKLDNKDLSDVTQVQDWEIFVMFNLVPGTGSIYFDDMKLIEK